MNTAARTWRIADRAVLGRIDGALARAARADWAEAEASDVVALEVNRAALMAYSVGEVRSDGQTVTVTPYAADPARSDRDQVAAALYATAQLVRHQIGPGVQVSADVGALPILAGAAIVVVSLASCATVAYVADRAALVVDRLLKRREDTQRLYEADAALQTLVAAHVERERVAGQMMPYDDATRAALAELVARQEAIRSALTSEAPMRSPIGDAMADGVPVPWWLLLAVGAAGWWTFRKRG